MFYKLWIFSWTLVVSFLLINICFPKWLMHTDAFALNSPWFCPSIFPKHMHTIPVCLCARRLSTWVIASMCNLPHHTHTCSDKHTTLNVIHHTLSSILTDVSLRFVAWPHIQAACLLKLHICLLIHSAAIQSSLQHNTQQKLIIKACCCTFTPYPHFWENDKNNSFLKLRTFSVVVILCISNVLGSEKVGMLLITTGQISDSSISL